VTGRLGPAHAPSFMSDEAEEVMVYARNGRAAR
jgi:hypothetical protein